MDGLRCKQYFVDTYAAAAVAAHRRSCNFSHYALVLLRTLYDYTESSMLAEMLHKACTHV